MTFISLINIKNQNIITIDNHTLVLRLEIDGNSKETRLKPYVASILYMLFNQHPTPLSYENIIEILKKQGLVISDVTRMHRKLSEIRRFISKFHLSLENLVLNTRGIGYSLPLYLKNVYYLNQTQERGDFANIKITQVIHTLYELINEAIEMTGHSKIIKHSQGYISDRGSFKHILVEQIATFNYCETVILSEICAHEADFNRLRIAYFLAKLKTYVGLTRISEYPISKTQWSDWFKQEVWMLFDELKKMIRYTENL